MEPVFPFDLTLDHAPAEGLTRALHHALKAAILDGRLAAGAALPSTRHAAEALDIARNTVTTAYDLLIAEGYVVPRHRAKPIVANVARTAPRPKNAAPPIDDRIHPRWREPDPFVPSRALPERSFRLGMPDHRWFPHHTWRRLSARTLRLWSKTPFEYPPAEGILELRAAIAQHVAFARAVACGAEDVVVTSGAQQAFDLLARLLVTPGRTSVAVEEPGYPALRAAFQDAGAEIVPVPLDVEGMQVERLRDVHVVSVTPSHQSPTGVALSLRRRMALLEFARRQGAVVLEDDYDGEFRFGGRPLDALQTLDRDGLVFYLGTFSKSLFPSLRKGFIVTPPWARDALIRVKRGCDPHADTLAQSTLAAFIREGHLARYVRRMRTIYAARREALLHGLRRELHPWLDPIPSEAGLHLAARIREPALAPRIVELAARHAPGTQSTQEYALAPLADPALAFGYGAIDADAIAPALIRLRRALEKLR